MDYFLSKHTTQPWLLVLTKTIVFFLLFCFITILVRNTISPLMITYDLNALLTPFADLVPLGLLNSFFKRLSVCILTIAFYLIFTRFVDKQPLRQTVFFPKTSIIKNILAGVSIVLLLIVLASFIGTAIGLITSEHFAPTPVSEMLAVVALWLLIKLPTAILEEVVFRGYILQSLTKILNPNISVAISAILFGLVHYPSSTEVIVTATIFGFFAGYFMLVYQNIYLPIALHWAGHTLGNVIYDPKILIITGKPVVLFNSFNISLTRIFFFEMVVATIILIIIKKLWLLDNYSKKN